MQTTQNIENANRKILEEVITGLSKSQKTLPSKYFYDKRGSALFEKICSLEEYYLTDAEMHIMKSNIDEISKAIGAGIELIELGSGSSYKTRLLLDHLKKVRTYVPVDISEEFLIESTRRLRTEYPDLHIIPVVADYSQTLPLPDSLSGRNMAIYFPGSSIGNFTLAEARSFLEMIAESTGNDTSLLIGVDLKKDRHILEEAYNDSKGITARFNKNILIRLNRDLNADFNPDLFDHEAFYNDTDGRIEMHLVSREKQKISINGHCFTLQKGESIHTENSHKYTLEEFEELVSGLFNVRYVWSDESNLFSIQYLQPVK